MKDLELKKAIEDCKNFNEVMDFLGWGFNEANCNIISKATDEELSESEYNKLMADNQNKIECEVLENDWNYTHYISIDNEYEVYIINEDIDE